MCLVHTNTGMYYCHLCYDLLISEEAGFIDIICLNSEEREIGRLRLTSLHDT